jgi:hypothetical protein
MNGRSGLNRTKKEKGFLKFVKMLAYNLVPARRSSLSITFSAVNWPASVWFEGNFAFLSTISADCLVHFFLIH